MARWWDDIDRRRHRLLRCSGGRQTCGEYRPRQTATTTSSSGCVVAHMSAAPATKNPMFLSSSLAFPSNGGGGGGVKGVSTMVQHLNSS